MKKILLYQMLIIPLCFQSCSNSNEEQHSDRSVKRTDLYIVFPDATRLMSDWSKENVVINHTLSDAGYLHPTNYTFQNAKVILSFTHPALLVIDQMKKGLHPCLAKSLPAVSADELQFTYELLDEAVWDDGSPVTGEDVAFTFKAAKCPLTDNPAHKPGCSNVKTVVIDAESPKRFTIVMKEKYIQGMSIVIDYPILCRKFFDPANALGNYTIEQMDDPELKPDQIPAIKNWAAEFNDGKYGNDLHYFYGCGAYKVVGWESGQSVTMQRKPNHWTEHLKGDNIYLSALPERIIFKPIKDENAMMLECKSQSIDASSFFQSRVLLDLQRDSNFNRNYNSAFMDGYTLTYMALNMKPDGVKHKRILDDVKVRRAIALLTPVDRIIEVSAMGKAKRWPSMVSPLKTDEFNYDLKLLPYDLPAASKLLEDAGWKDTDGDNIRDKEVDGERIPLQLELMYMMQGNMSKEMANMIVEGAYPAGVRIIPKPVEGSIIRQSGSNHDFDMFLSGWATSSLPQDFSQLWSTGAWTSKGSNYTGFGNADTDALIDSINTTLDDKLRMPMSKRLQKIIYDEQPYVFLYSPDRKIVLHKRFGNSIMTSEFPGFYLNNLLLLTGGAAAITSDVQ